MSDEPVVLVSRLRDLLREWERRSYAGEGDLPDAIEDVEGLIAEVDPWHMGWCLDCGERQREPDEAYCVTCAPEHAGETADD